MGKRIVVIAVDDTKVGLLAIDFALEHFCEGYEFHLLHISPSVASFPVPYPFPHAAALAQHHEERRLNDRATRHFVKEVFLPRASSKGASVVIADVDCVGTPESSNIGAAICRYVEDVSPAGVILMRHNMGILSRLFVGSVTKYCIENSKAPVIVVHPAVADI
ncbi:g8917 [Coccomyxa viridis]|uniref:G8917 protein n=1 Tax=Coccomyxa viridis TaxID=1274662 RepID=A0ABP1G1K7_9CHLO